MVDLVESGSGWRIIRQRLPWGSEGYRVQYLAWWGWHDARKPYWPSAQLCVARRQVRRYRTKRALTRFILGAIALLARLV